MNKSEKMEEGAISIAVRDARSRRVRVILAVGVLALYSLAFILLSLYYLAGPQVAVLAIPPVVAVGWLIGMRAGLLAGLLVFPLHILLLSLAGEAGWHLMTKEGLPVSLVVVAMGAIVGGLCDLNERMRMEISGRKLAEEKLRQEMEFSNILIQTSPAFFVAIGSEGKTIMMNDAMLDTLEYTMDEVVGRDYLTTFVAEDDRAMLSRVFEKLTKSNEPTLNENRVLTRDGRELLVEWHGRPVFNENGEFHFFFGLGIDITDRKRAEESLRERTEQVIRHQTALLELTKLDYSNLDSALKGITEMASKTLGVERVSVWFFTEDHSAMTCEALYKLSENLHEKGLRVETCDYPRCFAALESGRVIVANDARTDSRTSELGKDYLKPFDIISMISVPIRLYGKLVGVVAHGHVGLRREWTLEEQYFAASIADMVSLTLENSARKQAEESLRKRTEQVIRHQAALLELTKLDYSDLEASLKAITEMDAKTLGVERVSVWLLNEDHSAITCEDLYKLSENLHEKGLKFQVSDYPRYFEALEDGRAIVVNDARTDPRTVELGEGYMKSLDIVSTINVPIRLYGKLVGVVAQAHAGLRREWTLEEEHFAASIADIVALILESSARRRTEEELQKRFKELDIYYRATMGRESRIIELKDQVNELLKRLGEKKKYNV